MINLIFVNLISLLSFFINQAAAEDKTLVYQNHEYEAKVKSVLMVQKGSDERFPIINLGMNNALEVSFDVLEANNDYFQYTFVHCDKNWKLSSLNQTDFLKGNMFEEINEFKFSTNTYVQYTHYNFNFPAEKMKPIIAGNYLLKVYRNYDEEDLIFTRRFMVLNNKVSVSGTVNSATNVDLRFTHQEVDFEVDGKSFVMPNPFQDLHAIVLKNYSWMHATELLKPQFANGTKYTFNYEKENTVLGVNEFRFFDARGLRTFASGIKSKYFDSASNQTGVRLFGDVARGGKTYLYWKDNNGKTVYGNRDMPNLENSEDYLKVHFVLQPNALFDANDRVYVLGEFNNWKPNPYMEMVKNRDGNYESSFSLKQGYYNYLYALQDEKGNLDFAIPEGEHMETENDYRVLVYHKNQFLQYDELIGFMFLNSLNARKKE